MTPKDWDINKSINIQNPKLWKNNYPRELGQLWSIIIVDLCLVWILFGMSVEHHGYYIIGNSLVPIDYAKYLKICIIYRVFDFVFVRIMWITSWPFKKLVVFYTLLSYKLSC